MWALRSDEELILETTIFQIFYGSNSTFINSFDKTKFLKFQIPAASRSGKGKEKCWPLYHTETDLLHLQSFVHILL